MKFLHTADWHVGKTLRGRSRAEEHIAVLSEIVDIARDREVDAVFIVGDLFESSAPTPESERIVYNALLQFSAIAKFIVIVSGNHDNAMRFEAIKPLLKLTNIHVLSFPSKPDEGGVFSFRTDRDEHINLSLLPFLSQRAIVRADDLISKGAIDHAQEYADRAVRIIEMLCNDFSNKCINIFLGHAMVQGGVLGGGERFAHTVFEYCIPTSAFPSILHYAALGHLHRAQKLAGACPIWYAGSPLSLDFSEGDDVKSVNVVEVRAGKPAKVEQVLIKSGKRLRTIRATLDSLNAMKEEIKGDFLRIEIIGSNVPGLADQVREMLPNAVDVRLVKSEIKPPSKRVINPARSPQDLFGQYLKERNEEHDGLKKLFNELLEEVYATDQA